MKKYIIMALMPFVFQSALQAKNHFAELDQVLVQYYQDTCKAINSNVKHHFEPVLHALIHDAKKGGNRRRIAIEYIVLLEKHLEMYRSDEIKKVSYASWAVGSKPKIITGQIDPALQQVEKALKDLKVTKSEYSFAFKFAIGALALAVVAGAGVAYANKDAILDYIANFDRPGIGDVGSDVSTSPKQISFNQSDFQSKGYIGETLAEWDNPTEALPGRVIKRSVGNPQAFVGEEEGDDFEVKVGRVVDGKFQEFVQVDQGFPLIPGNVSYPTKPRHPDVSKLPPVITVNEALNILGLPEKANQSFAENRINEIEQNQRDLPGYYGKQWPEVQEAIKVVRKFFDFIPEFA